uniref:GAG-pre-integrase domain-containing protein n=1 Tax=Nicotiana tabacum TaxID=4097 RepID=A0A1S3YYF3_TOBAC|nr:PREDICTED: uncharacterized protein LOC107780997 [Nicotiana tabacum]
MTNNGKSGWNNPNTGKKGGNGGNVGKPGGRKIEPMAMINNADVSTSSMQDMGDGPSGVAEHKGYHYFTNDQYNQILYLWNKESNPESNMANMAGALGHYITTSQMSNTIKFCISGTRNQILSQTWQTWKVQEQDLWNGKVKGIGKERGGLYVLRGLASRIKAFNVVNRASRDSSEVWNNMLGHPSALVMKHVVGLNNKNSEMSHENCLICPLAKQTTLKFPLFNSRTKVAFHLVQIDLWGPYKIATFDKE